jgi:hypothetical protein
MSWADGGRGQQQHSDGASQQGELTCPDCPLTKNRLKEVESAINTRAVLAWAQANKIEKRWSRGIARYMYEAR